jgi:flagellar hook-associated protein 1 FlgK
VAGIINILNLGRRALLAQEMGLAVTGNNIANANTEGYTRQEIRLQSDSVRVPGLGGLGTGVKVASIDRARDLFADNELRRETQVLGYWRGQSENLSRLETVVNDLTESGLADALGSFWQGWQELSDHPEDRLARETVVERGRILAEDINDLASRVALLNERVVAAHGQAPALQDERDRLLDQMASLANVTATPDSSGAVTVRLGGRMLVAGKQAIPLQMVGSAEPGTAGRGPCWSNDGSAAGISGGEIGGLMALRDTVIPDMEERLDRLAWTVGSEVNRLHRAGTDLNGTRGGDFFILPSGADEVDPSGSAAALQVRPALLADVSTVAAGLDGSAGDNRTALAIAALDQARPEALGKSTVQEYWAALSGSIGGKVSEAANRLSEHEAAVEQFQNLREASTGVSLDEEATRLIAYEQAYAAAARLISTADELARDLIDIL